MSAGSQNGVQEHMGDGCHYRGKEQGARSKRTNGAVMRPSCGCRRAWVHFGHKIALTLGRARADIDEVVTDYSGKCGEFGQRELLAWCARCSWRAWAVEDE